MSYLVDTNILLRLVQKNNPMNPDAQRAIITLKKQCESLYIIAILSLLLRYKHRSEWFYQDKLYDLATDKENTRKAEKLLALDLYSYLHDQGLDFSIEPSSHRGKIDLIAAQGSDDPLLADTKIFDAKSRGKDYIRKGFRQIYTYTNDYNEPFGYLIIYKITDKDLKFSLATPSRNIPVIIYNHKTIFLITIDIYPHSEPVSHRKPLKAISITEQELIQTAEEEIDEKITQNE
ncbi:MAG: hypothetical protein RLZZ507_588 [Cyanobacteriota bacterium]|jgi:hypothetical protein